jgi:arylsulfatase A-like enzyme
VAIAALAAGAAAGTDARASERPDHSSARQRPNVVVVMTDDQRLDEMRFMPKTRELIGEPGTTFDNEVVSYSLCCPARATFLTGQYAHNNQVQDNVPPWGGYGKFDFSNALGVWLQEAGYNTAHLGKMLNGYGSDSPSAPVPRGYDDWFATIDPLTYQMYGFRVQDNDTVVSYPLAQTTENYQATVLGDRAVANIAKYVPRRRPFFMQVAPSSPHFEITNVDGGPRAAPADEGLYADLPFNPAPSFDEADTSDKPSVTTHWPRLSDGDKATIAERFRDRAEAIKSLDDMVGRIVDALRETGELGNTVIMFTSDNGYLMGEHRWFGEKVVPYEASIRVPLLIRGPGFPRGVHREQLVSTTDFAPTIIQLADAKARLVIDGESLLPFAKNPGYRRNRAIGLEATFHQLTGQLLALLPRYAGVNIFFDGVRSNRFMYAHYHKDVSAAPADENELYDLEEDPYELRSAHENPKYAQTRIRLERLTRELANCKGKGCWLSFSAAP